MLPRLNPEQLLGEEDYEWVRTILDQALEKEWQFLAEGRAADDVPIVYRTSHCRCILSEPHKLRDGGLTYRTEIVGDTRRTSAAVSNGDADRHSWERVRPVRSPGCSAPAVSP